MEARISATANITIKVRSHNKDGHWIICSLRNSCDINYGKGGPGTCLNRNLWKLQHWIFKKKTFEAEQVKITTYNVHGLKGEGEWSLQVLMGCQGLGPSPLLPTIFCKRSQKKLRHGLNSKMNQQISAKANKVRLKHNLDEPRRQSEGKQVAGAPTYLCYVSSKLASPPPLQCHECFTPYCAVCVPIEY